MNRIKKLSGFALVGAAALALAACGPGDQRLCTEANWYQTGVHHAQQGWENRYRHLEEICAKIGVIRDAVEYDRGYQDGPTLPRLSF